MDQEPEDWTEKKRIKAEIKKAETANDKENAASLANFEAEIFAQKKSGFTNDPETIRLSGEKFGGIAALFAVLGLIGAVIFKFLIRNIASVHSGEARADNEAALRALGILEDIFSVMIGISGVVGVAAIIAVIIYRKETGKKNMSHILIASLMAVIIAIFWFMISPWI